MKQRYDSYKPSGIDWIGEIPSHWKVVKMRYLRSTDEILAELMTLESETTSSLKSLISEA